MMFSVKNRKTLNLGDSCKRQGVYIDWYISRKQLPRSILEISMKMRNKASRGITRRLVDAYMNRKENLF